MVFAKLALALAIAAPAQHGVIHRSPYDVEVWRDASGEYAMRYAVESRITVVAGRTVFVVDDGALTRRERFLSPAAAWSRLAPEYAVSRAQVDAALAHGDLVPRPAVMTPPRPGTAAVTYIDHFGRNVPALQRVVSWSVPAPGPTLLGLRLDDAFLVTFEGTRFAGEEYRSGTRFINLLASPTASRVGFWDGSLIVRRSRGSYVTITPQGWTPSPSDWRTLSARARA